MKGSKNDENRKKYSVIPYLIGLFVVIIMLVVWSYLAESKVDKAAIAEENIEIVTEFNEMSL